MDQQISNCFYRIGIKALILDQEKNFLLLKEENGWWELPGGGLQWDETPQEALERELQEETGLQTIFIADQPSYFITTIHTVTKIPMANVIYRVEVKNLNFTPSSECIEIKFFSPKDCLKEQNIYPNVKKFANMFRPTVLN